LEVEARLEERNDRSELVPGVLKGVDLLDLLLEGEGEEFLVFVGGEADLAGVPLPAPGLEGLAGVAATDRDRPVGGDPASAAAFSPLTEAAAARAVRYGDSDFLESRLDRSSRSRSTRSLISCLFFSACLARMCFSFI